MIFYVFGSKDDAIGEKDNAIGGGGGEHIYIYRYFHPGGLPPRFTQGACPQVRTYQTHVASLQPPLSPQVLAPQRSTTLGAINSTLKENLSIASRPGLGPRHFFSRLLCLSRPYWNMGAYEGFRARRCLRAEGKGYSMQALSSAFRHLTEARTLLMKNHVVQKCAIWLLPKLLGRV